MSAGAGWLHRNWLKSDQGDHWLRVPILTAGRSRQTIGDVEVARTGTGGARHLRSVRELYVHAPYLQPHLTAVEAIYARCHRMLATLNIDLIRHLWDALGDPHEAVSAVGAWYRRSGGRLARKRV
jgi:hypothetical protein